MCRLLFTQTASPARSPAIHCMLHQGPPPLLTSAPHTPVRAVRPVLRPGPAEPGVPQPAHVPVTPWHTPAGRPVWGGGHVCFEGASITTLTAAARMKESKVDLMRTYADVAGSESYANGRKERHVAIVRLLQHCCCSERFAPPAAVLPSAVPVLQQPHHIDQPAQLLRQPAAATPCPCVQHGRGRGKFRWGNQQR